MATIYNSDLSKEIRDGAKLQVRDIMPSQLAEKVVPVMEVNPKLLRRATFNRANRATNATSATVYTCDSVKDTFLTNVSLGVIKDATSTSTFSSITAVPRGSSSRALIEIPGITLTPQSEVVTMNLNPPLLLEKGSTITVTATTNVANIQVAGCIVGYEVENVGA